MHSADYAVVRCPSVRLSAGNYLHPPMASLIIVCCAGHRIFTDRRQSTRRPLAGPGGRSTRMSSWHLCDERQWQGLNGDALAELYDKAISELLDHQVPVQLIICRRRTTSTWFDDDYMFSHDIPQVHYPSNSSVDSLQVSPVPSVLRPHSLFASLSLIWYVFLDVISLVCALQMARSWKWTVTQCKQ